MRLVRLIAVCASLVLCVAMSSPDGVWSEWRNGQEYPLALHGATAHDTMLYAVNPGPMGPLSNTKWTRVFSEEFDEVDTTALLANGKWWFGNWGNGQITGPVNSLETTLLYRGCLTVRNGTGRFLTRPNTEGLVDPGNGATAPNLGSGITTDPLQGANPGFQLNYGFIEARYRSPRGVAGQFWPGWWASGDHWPTGMEIDVVEGDGTDAGQAFNIHYGTVEGQDTTNLNGLGAGRVMTVPGATTEMHTYGADIRADGVTFYYDGRRVYRYVGTVPNAPRNLIIGNSTSWQGPVPSADSIDVDYVRAWTRVV